MAAWGSPWGFLWASVAPALPEEPSGQLRVTIKETFGLHALIVEL